MDANINDNLGILALGDKEKYFCTHKENRFMFYN